MASRRGDKERLRAERLEAERRAAAAERRRRPTLVGAAIVGVVVVGGDHRRGPPLRLRRRQERSDTDDRRECRDHTAPRRADDRAAVDQRRGRLPATAPTRAGLAVLSAEGTALHIHEHLDVFVAGKATSVPAGIGIDPAQQFISPLHTHDPTGVAARVESPNQRTFTLGQFFGVWVVPLTAPSSARFEPAPASSCAYVNGEPFTGDPASIELAPHHELVIAYGTATQMPKPVPSRYNFPPGL